MLETFKNISPFPRICSVRLIDLTLFYHQVSKRVAEMVLENHPAYAAELQKVMELQQALQNASIVCANGRRYAYISIIHLYKQSLYLVQRK